MAVVSLYAGLRKVAGARKAVVNGNSLAGILLALDKRYPAVGQLILDGGQLRPHIVVTINGHTIDPALGLDTPVGVDDHIAIFPPIAGG